MNPDLLTLPPLPYAHRGYYQHLSPRDTALWDQFITRYPNEFELVWYDIPCGCTPLDGQPNDPPWLERYATQTYCKRIDVIAQAGSHFHIIELKPNAGMTALGQVIMYTHCLRDQVPKSYRLEPHIITDHADPDLFPLLARFGVTLDELDKTDVHKTC